ncbi:amino acid ABC transporter permease [Paracoccus sp. IB05]|uniref:amino acid ABC transporter permease n=1 Tax=Paracoccus sp. IB05 TaxID=2779367 RepID=UPI0018E6F331|nr:amino acid ABC transporter permease [Paracoccus sp. IB05]
MEFGVVLDHLPLLVGGALRGVLYAVGGFVIGIACAALIILGRMAWGRWVTIPSQIFVEIVRNTPFLLQAFFLYFGLAKLGVMMPGYVAAIIIVTFNSAAYATEILRSGMLGIPKGLLEAGDSLGFTALQQFRYVVARPMLRAALPALSGQFIIIMLNTSLLSAIAIPELNYEASNLASTSFRPFEVYVVVAVIYLTLSSVFAGLFALIRRRVSGSWGSERRMQDIV